MEIVWDTFSWRGPSGEMAGLVQKCNVTNGLPAGPVTRLRSVFFAQALGQSFDTGEGYLHPQCLISTEQDLTLEGGPSAK